MDSLPDGFLSADPQYLLDIFSGPALIHLKGEKSQPLFISTLLHGNEVTGFAALQEILKKYKTLPRDLLIFIGNVEAASYNVRTLKHQRDFNRIWSDKEINELFPDQVKKRKLNKWHYKIPQGESYEILYKRVKKFINKRIKFKKNYVIFTHDMVSRVFRGYLMKYKKEKILNSEHKNSSIFICDKKKIKEIRL